VRINYNLGVNLGVNLDVNLDVILGLNLGAISVGFWPNLFLKGCLEKVGPNLSAN